MKLSILLMMISFSAFAADNDCVNCGAKVAGMPLNVAMIDKLAKASTEPFKDAANRLCLKFEQISEGEIEAFMDDLDQTNYTINDYFQRPGCQAKSYGKDIKSPMIQLAADLPMTREGFPEMVYLYYTKRKKDNQSWIKAINSKNDNGETFLDYIETRVKDGKYPNAETAAAITNIKNFICEKGGTYSKYKDKKCP